MKARAVAGRGWKSLLCDPGSELYELEREREEYVCAKIMSVGFLKKKKKKT